MASLTLLAFLCAASIRLGAQQTETDRKRFEDNRTKAEKGDANAQYSLGLSYANGWGVPQDDAEAVKWFRKAAEQGLAEAQNNLGACYWLGRGVAQSYVDAVKWLRKAAEQGVAKAQYNLGLCCDRGQGVPQDDAEALKWHRRAADQGYAPAQYKLGVWYYEGRGVAQDDVMAVRWFRKAGDQGDAGAALNLGVCYHDGRGVTRDDAEAVKWFRKAAEQGLALAEYNLGLCYTRGEGVAQDFVEALKWYRKAAEQGLALAEINLGLCYARGDGVAQDVAEAVKWFRKAADQGDAKAQALLGVSYALGQGVARSGLEAYIWLSLAAIQGVSEAARQRDRLANDLTPDEIAEGKRRVAAFVPSKRAPIPESTVPLEQADVASNARWNGDASERDPLWRPTKEQRQVLGDIQENWIFTEVDESEGRVKHTLLNHAELKDPHKFTCTVKRQYGREGGSTYAMIVRLTFDSSESGNRLDADVPLRFTIDGEVFSSFGTAIVQPKPPEHAYACNVSESLLRALAKGKRASVRVPVSPSTLDYEFSQGELKRFATFVRLFLPPPAQ